MQSQNDRVNPPDKSITFVSDFALPDRDAVITGVMVQTYLLGKALAEKKWIVHAVASSTHPAAMETRRRDGMTFLWYFHRRFFPLQNTLKILQLLLLSGSSVYYQRGRDPVSGLIALFCRAAGRTFVWASAGETGLERWKYTRQVFNKRRPWWIKLLLLPEACINDLVYHYGIRHAHIVIVQTTTQRARLRQTFKRDGVVVQSGHEVPAIETRPFPVKVLWIGSIKAVKRPEAFIELARKCRGWACEFWLAGQDADPELGQRLRRASGTLDNLKFLGAIPFEESGRRIARAHVLVNTTLAEYEGLPNTFVQAWLAGTVILTLCANPDEVVTRHQLGYQCSTVEEMVVYLKRWIEQPEEWERLSENCRRYGQSKFSIGAIAGQLEDAIVSAVL